MPAQMPRIRASNQATWRRQSKRVFALLVGALFVWAVMIKISTATKITLSSYSQLNQGHVRVRSRNARTRHVSVPRHVVVENQCRCGRNQCFVKGEAIESRDTGVVQPGSLATGPTKAFTAAVRECSCVEGDCNTNTNGTLAGMGYRYDSAVAHNKTLVKRWAEIPDFGYERDLPIFVGALSFMSPRSLEAGLQNWNASLFSPAVVHQFKDFFIHLNNRSDADDEILERFTRYSYNVQFRVSGDSGNSNVGKVIADQCRMAEQSLHSHPRGENIILWLEKDWHWNPAHSMDKLNNIIDSARELLQRGVVKLNMRPAGSARGVLKWPCRGQNMTWQCGPGFQFHNMNSPMLMRCDWFLRYFEPYALFDDPIMLAHGRAGRKRKYFDWEEAGMDGRIEWVNSNWILGATLENALFRHIEIDESDMYKR